MVEPVDCNNEFGISPSHSTYALEVPTIFLVIRNAVRASAGPAGDSSQ